MSRALNRRPLPPTTPKTSGLTFNPTSCEVVTVTEKLPDAPEESVKVEGNTVQTAYAGAPVHPSVTVPLNPDPAVKASS